MWLHGTNQVINKFRISRDIQGINTGSNSCQDLIYFTDSTDLSGDYANAAANKLYFGDHNGWVKKMDRMAEQYNSLIDKNQFDDADKIMEELEILEQNLQESKSGHCIYAVYLEPQNAMTIDFKGREWGGERTEDVLRLARQRKVDALFIKNVIDRVSMMEKGQPMKMAVVFDESIISPAFGYAPKGITPDMLRPSYEYDRDNSLG